MGIFKSRDGHACVIDVHDTRIRVEREVEGHGRRHLGDEADVRDGGTLVMAEPAARGMLGEQRLNRLQASAKPMLDPGEPLVLETRFTPAIATPLRSSATRYGCIFGSR